MMPDDRRSRKQHILEMSVEEMHLENGNSHKERGRLNKDGIKEEHATSNTASPRDIKMKSISQSPVKDEKLSQSPGVGAEKHEEVVGGDVTVKQEPGKPPKLARSTSQKIVSGPPALFNDHPNKAEEAKGHFQLIPACLYSNKYIGSTEHGSMDCDCAEEWDGSTKTNAACGEDSDCINRATKMECVGDCGCGAECQNQRFQQQQYASVAVIKTEKKGYGLRADTDLRPHDFIFEYIGEVINEAQFRRRMIQYDEEGIKHFYFMSLTKGEFVDATKKGNLGRFCNHSCNPNCYVDKWVVGDKLRMGIFAERKIKAGEELVFNYNVDRYGANPQPCYCGEPNCTGFIGGKTQTERATKLSNTTIEALGIDDADGWDTAVAKKPRKKKVGEEDEEYVNNVQPKSLDEDGVTKVMATLMQCKEKWIAVKLLGRIQRCEDERVRNRVVKMHGYQILNSTLAMWKDDPNVVLQVFDILDKFPRLTRNKISDSKIETTVESLKTSGDERVETKADYLLKEWSILEVAYRIPRKKREIIPNATPEKSNHYRRRDSSREERKPRSKSRSPDRSRSRSRSRDTPKGPAAPSGPRSGYPQRNPGFYSGPRPPFRPRPFSSALPPGWFSALDENNRTYYYDLSGKTTWERPTSASAPPPPPPKPTSTNKALEDIINEITSAKANTPKDKQAATAAPQTINGETKKSEKSSKEKWRGLSEEKQKKLYENTLFPHIKHVVDKFKGKLPKDDIKRFAKEISKKLVNSDFKAHRVEDPTKISSRQEKQIKKFVKEYFEKAVLKHQEREKKRAEKKTKEAGTAVNEQGYDEIKKEEESDGDQDIAMSDDDELKPKMESTTPITPMDAILSAEGLKRKREADDNDDNATGGVDELTPNKRVRSETPPPPPPPPAPADGVYPSPITQSNESMGEDPNTYAVMDTYSDSGAQSHEASPDESSLGPIKPPPPPPPPSGLSDAQEMLEDDDDHDVAANGRTSDMGDSDMTPRDGDQTMGEHERPFSKEGSRHNHAVQA